MTTGIPRVKLVYTRDRRPKNHLKLCTPASVYPPPLVRGEDTLAGWSGGWGSIFWKTPDTALYSTYVSTLWSVATASILNLAGQALSGLWSYRPARLHRRCAARAFCYCPAIISHRPRSQNIFKEQALNPEKESRIKRPRSQVSLEKSSQNYKPLEK